MKQVIITIITIIVVIILAILFLSDEVGKDASYTGEVFAFSCESGQDVRVQYGGEDNQFGELRTHSGSYELERARAASGARYTNGDESVVFWNQGQEAMIQVAGEDAYEGCTLSSGSQGQNDASDEDAATSSDEVLGSVADWQTYESGAFVNDYRFTMEYPSEVETSEPTESRVSFKYIGPESEPATEITDGFTLAVHAEGPITADAYAQRQEPVNPIEETTVAGREAITFETTSELGTQVTHLVFKLENQAGKGTVVDITRFVGGDDEAIARYEATIEAMLETLSFSRER